MRLFHEAGGTWFWWSMETGAQYVRLWKYAFNPANRQAPADPQERE